ncbi:MAG: hypothetical protein LAN64_02320 [Acidobacteriia bacterium]|nr:hypothetical protein [Terriglobia bacterium]
MTDGEPLPVPRPEVSVYRDHCIALLRRYFYMAVEIGRLPALLGREYFRTNAQDYHVHSFENIAIFVIDVERCLDRLQPFDQDLVARIVLQEYEEEEAAKLLHCGLRTIERRLPEALDALTEMFLNNSMLNTAQRVPHHAILPAEKQVHCRKRVPQRARIQAQATASRIRPTADIPQPQKLLVKPPNPDNPLYPPQEKENIILPDVAGLPSRVCYAEFIS